MEVSNLIADVGSLLTQVVTIISGNPALCAFLGLSLISSAAGVFWRIKRSSH